MYYKFGEIANALAFKVRGLVAEVHVAPVIVMGNAKSGTSAIAHLLADACCLSKTIDIPPLWSPNAQAIMRGELKFADVVKRLCTVQNN